MKHFDRIEDGRLVLKGEKRKKAPKVDPYWSNGRRSFLITDMTDPHLINTIKKLQGGSGSYRSVFRHGKIHSQYKQLVLEAAKRGLCLKFRPQLTGMQTAITKLRTAGRKVKQAVVRAPEKVKRMVLLPPLPQERKRIAKEAAVIDPTLEINEEEIEDAMMADDL